MGLNMSDTTKIVMCSIFAALAQMSCRTTSGQSDKIKGINIDNRSLAVDAALSKQDIQTISIMPNTKTPKGFVITLNDITFDTVKKIYKVVHDINVQNNLKGLQGPDQEITLVAVAPTNDIVSRFIREMKPQVNITSNSELPYFQKIFAAVDIDIWMQDWGEIAGAKMKNGKVAHLILDTGRGFLNSDRDVSVFAETLGIPFLRVPADSAKSPGSFGGNIEATPEGVFYHGETMDAEVLDAIVRRGNSKHITLPTKWLQTQHIDEYISFIPSHISRCNAALVHGSPLDALLILSKASSQDVTGTDLPDPASVASSLRYFSKSAGNGHSMRTNDYNAEKTPRADKLEIDSFVSNQLRIQKLIDEAILAFRNNNICADDLIPLPQLYFKDTNDLDGAATSPELDAQALEEAAKFARFSSLMANPVNMLVLRNHVIIAEQKASAGSKIFRPFADIIRARLEPHLRNSPTTEHVHFIDSSPYHHRGGGIHCGTNVIRELD